MRPIGEVLRIQAALHLLRAATDEVVVGSLLRLVAADVHPTLRIASAHGLATLTDSRAIAAIDATCFDGDGTLRSVCVRASSRREPSTAWARFAGPIHVIVEADSQRELANGVRAFSISVAKSLNAKLGHRRGAIFADRYHAKALTNPTAARNAIRYVLNNWLHHRDWDHEAGSYIDPYSSGANFLGWKELGGTQQFERPEGFERVCTAAPVLWLTCEGWKRGGEISVFAIPR